MTDTCSIYASPSAAPEHNQDFNPGPGKHVLYFGDPMCSWCWGFAPELDGIATQIKDRARLHIIMGGLRPGTHEPWDQKMRDYIRHHWEDVAAKTGQPFDYARLADEGFVYDTEPACRALVAVRTINPDAALAMYEALQRAFYAEGRDIGHPATLADIAAGCGVNRDDFTQQFATPETRMLTTHDFNRTRAFGITGFPSVVCAEDGEFAVLSLGYRPHAAMGPLLEEWLNA